MSLDLLLLSSQKQKGKRNIREKERIKKGSRVMMTKMSARVRVRKQKYTKADAKEPEGYT